jgi:hypothetical protein
LSRNRLYQLHRMKGQRQLCAGAIGKQGYQAVGGPLLEPRRPSVVRNSKRAFKLLKTV